MGIGNSATINIGVLVFVGIPVSNSFMYMEWKGVIESCVNSKLTY